MFKTHAVLMDQIDEGSSAGPAIATMTASDTPNTPEIQYRVWDSLASIGQTRTHQIVAQTYKDGRDPDLATYLLKSDGDGTPMPVEHALKFLSDKSFVVKNPLGERILPPARAEGGLGAFNLEIDQTVAYYHELSKLALFKRCKMQVGSEHIQAVDTAESMIEFLKSVELKRRRPTSDDGEVAARMAQGVLGGAVEDKIVERMFA